MKKKLATLLAVVVTFSLVACGDSSDTEQLGSNNNDNLSLSESESINNNVTVESDVDFTQAEKFLGYTVYCPTDCSIRNSDYGKAFSYKTDFSVIIEAPAAVGSMYAVDGLEDAIEKSEEYVCKSLESRNSDLFHPSATTQTVTESKTVEINGNEALRVVGNFNNTQNNTEVEYVAYYLIASTADGTSYPLYIIGIPLAESNGSLESFMDDMASHIER